MIRDGVLDSLRQRALLRISLESIREYQQGRRIWHRSTTRRKRGSGTIQRQRDGSYIARTADQSRSGRFPAGSKGYREAEEALEKWNRAVSAGRDPNDSRMKLRDFIRLWLIEGCKKVQPSTREFYARHAGYATATLAISPRADRRTRD
jgi:hypothetical protein